MISDAGNQADLLGPKIRELISLAVAVIVEWDACIVVHTDAALKAGVTEQEINEAPGVAVAVKAGSALIFSTRVLDAVKARSGQQTESLHSGID